MSLDPKEAAKDITDVVNQVSISEHHMKEEQKKQHYSDRLFRRFEKNKKGLERPLRINTDVPKRIRF